ncbi:hypothetical protein CS063_12825 [Sporanaerobium hydrogeniformans]|uniref:Uncharacterized protein n=1 Tax=Sporanaerobium hydrogeniformans TaxID=3072179 RepID=A0AC61DAE4_9FIRM|nr:ABC transporter permease [Sporanaerobium hydrogeniformans]PHV70023.1 hypothetical protein CS063_12825 [Sporanaerobium hydrogeniformans]
METSLIIAKEHLKLFFYRPLAFLFFCLPIVVTLIFAIAFRETIYEPQYKVSIVGERHISGIDFLLHQLDLEKEAYFDTEEVAIKRLIKGEIDGILYIESSQFVENILSGEKAISLVMKAPNQKTQVLKERVDIALERIQQLARKGEDFSKPFAQLQSDRVKKNEKSKEVILQNFSLFVMLFLFTCSKSLEVILIEKETWAYEKMMTTSLTKGQYVVGHLAGAFLILLVQLGIQGLVMKGLGFSFAMSYLAFMGVGVILILVGISISFLLLVSTSNRESYSLFCSICITTLCMISGCIFPAELLSEKLNQIGYISPIHWIMVIYRGVLEGAEPLALLGGVGIAIGISIILILIAVIIENEKKKIA